MELCRFFAQGRCAFGTACRLSHGDQDRSRKVSEKPSRDERRVDPDDGQKRTLLELRRHYSGRYQPDEIDRYWKEDCEPVPSHTNLEDSAPSYEAQTLCLGQDKDGWCTATQICSVSPSARSSDLSAGCEAVRKVEGLQCRVLNALQVELSLHERVFLIAAPRNGSAGTEFKEEAKLEKKLREISALRSRQQSGEVLEKLQAEKVNRRAELFGQVAELKLRRGHEELCVRSQALTNGNCSHLTVGDEDEAYLPSKGEMPCRPERRPPGCIDPEEVECGICFEVIGKKGKKAERFGLLESCDHAFCLTCIRAWRREREQQDRANLRLCPVCRNESFFVIPSEVLVMDQTEKRRLIDEYKTEMGRKPCKLFDYGRGTCPFGTSCFYAHLNPDGTRYVPPPLRWMAGAEGSEVRAEVKLSDFFS